MFHSLRRRVHARLLAVLLLLVVAACDDGPGMPSGPADPDQELLELLLTVVPGGPEGLILPASHDFARIPQDPRNPLTPAKVALGRLLFHETALGVDAVRPEGRETYSCASCHHAQGGFQANLPQGLGEGGRGFGQAGEGRTHWDIYAATDVDVQPIRTPSILNTAYQELMLWNGQFGAVGANVGTRSQWTAGTPKASNNLGFHGLETQAHAGLGVHRQEDVARSPVAEIPEYRDLFAEAFPGDADPVNRLNAALAIAAFERTVLANQSPWQRWLQGDPNAMSADEKRGAVVFFGDGGCVACHTGPALSSMTFHALGMADLDRSVDPSRVNLAATDGEVDDPTRRGRGGFTGRTEDAHRFKTPQLYNLADSPFYGHGATFSSIREVVEYKNRGVPQLQVEGLSPSFRPLGLTDRQVELLTLFLERSLRDPDLLRYVPRSLPSGHCVTVNDPESRADLGCGGG